MNPFFPLCLGFMLSLSGTPVSADAATEYDATCAACHNLGVAGAPKLGDKEAWKERIAQGHVILYKHAIEGFTGQFGIMPPKGGFADMSNNQVKTIVEYMVSKSR